MSEFKKSDTMWLKQNHHYEIRFGRHAKSMNWLNIRAKQDHFELGTFYRDSLVSQKNKSKSADYRGSELVDLLDGSVIGLISNVDDKFSEILRLKDVKDYGKGKHVMRVEYNQLRVFDGQQIWMPTGLFIDFDDNNHRLQGALEFGGSIDASTI